MKTKRNLSGIYFRFQDPSGSWGNRCFEDLPIEDQNRLMKSKSKEWIESLAIKLADTLNLMGEQFDILSNEP
jgi:hypothetical protein